MHKRGKDTIRVLLVDDEDAFRSTMVKRLGKRGFEVGQAESGPACLSFLEKNSVDVVVMDVKMPGMGGIQVLEKIRASDACLQVILLTGNAAVSDGVDGIKAGAFDYLTKPVEIDHLENKIRQAFDLCRLEEEKRIAAEYRAQLEAKMIETERLASLGTLSTGIAHEINNPLAIINEAAGFMKQVIADPGQACDSKKQSLLMGIEKIEKSIHRARKITFQLLGHVKRQDTQLLEFDLSELLRETLSLLKKEISDKQIQVAWEPECRPCVINSDPYQIRQVLINILNNAVQAMKQGGVLTLGIRKNMDEICLTVKDNGVGIPREHLSRIFDPFFTTKSSDEGTGLGLFVVYKILSSLGGNVSFDSKVGEGTCCTIRLPEKAVPPEDESLLKKRICS